MTSKKERPTVPLIIVETPEEVETNLMIQGTSSLSQSSESQQSYMFNHASNVASSATHVNRNWTSKFTTSSTNYTNKSIDMCKERKSKRQSCQYKIFKNRSKMPADMRYSVEDAIQAFKKMRLNTDEDENMEPS